MAKGDVLVRMKADVGNYNANMAAASRTLKNFRDENLSLGGVFKNITRSFTGYAAGLMSIGAVAGKLHETVTEAVQLAKSAEGIRLAFNRLNDPSILDGLRQATHGTVTDVELMKAAVKFNDFKLPVEELGTMLAFAQQKAKDTGQSVDYMVDSIVTGLGRKSLMILDNLGLSASDIKERMKQTGDMTKAVGEIIREQMAKAGDYIETASDRLARAIAENENAMLKLGDAMRDTFGASGLDEMSASLEKNLIVELTEVVKNLGEAKNLINDITGSESGFSELANTIGSVAKEVFYWGTGIYNIWRLYNKFKGEDEIPVLGTVIGNIQKSPQSPDTHPLLSTGGDKRKRSAQVFGADTIGAMEQYISELQKKWKAAGEDVRDLYTTQIENARNVLAQMKGEMPEGSVAALTKEMQELRKEQSNVTNVSDWRDYEKKIKDVNNRIKELKGELGLEALRGMKGVSVSDVVQLPTRKSILKKGDAAIKNFKVQDKPTKQEVKLTDIMNQMSGGISSMVSGLEQLGIELPQGMKDVLGGIQSVTSILTGISTIVSAIEVISTAKLIPFVGASGGVVKAAVGYVSGRTFSGDMIPARLNAGETVLNQAQAGVIANALQDREFGGGASLQPYVDGEKIFLGMNNTSKRMGRGEIVTTSTLRRLGLI